MVLWHLFHCRKRGTITCKGYERESWQRIHFSHLWDLERIDHLALLYEGMARSMKQVSGFKNRSWKLCIPFEKWSFD
ncbi:hypothetical protein CEXT_36971 [Caerostris extrusa]|uniref:Uncharacterized protein n=1 Tax=Caerostris extrusa TaxID=172846 RepID=A0AAV4UMY8_CAEEX|nr:hypothetical protein CEXT_36971 [Caerostris extrusa]